MKRSRLFVSLLAVAVVTASVIPMLQAQSLPWSQRMANAAMTRWPDGHTAQAGQPEKWNYELGTLLDGMDAVWLNTVDPQYFNYIKASVDQLVQPDGSIPTYKAQDNELDSILLGRQLLLLYGVTQNKRYLTAATTLYEQLQHQPRNASGGFWHKQRYPNQMWLDGLYMAEPFYAEYSVLSHHPENFKDITRQFVLMEQHARDPKTGLLYHGWDESKQQRWANKTTGDSSQFWARGMGWYMMALVDTLPYYPKGAPGRQQLIEILNRTAAAVIRYQSPTTGLWYQVLNRPDGKGNYFESSAACMFVYALARGVRLGYLPEHYGANAEHGYKGILSHFVKTGPGDEVTLTGTVKGVGLGGDPYRDGSYSYYISEKVDTNDAKGVGAFILAATEMENVQNARLGRGDTVMVDAWFNSQKRMDAFGHQIYFHYKWDDWAPSGFSLFGHIFKNFGAHLTTLYTEPKVADLKKAQVYVIPSPDNKDKNPNPHYANAQDAGQIAEWVKGGGVLVILENDTSFADLDHFNVVAEKFGMHFNDILRKHVIGTDWSMGKIQLEGNGPIFHHPHTIYVKDVCTISLKPPARSLLQEGSDVFMAEAKYGKGTVVAMVDPWLYNEYTDGRKLPAVYENYAAGVEFARWILQQVPR